MRREKAIRIMKEIALSCKLLDPSAISLDQTSQGQFEIRVKADFDDISWERLKMLAKKHVLGLKMNEDMLLIYEPLDMEDAQLIVV